MMQIGMDPGGINLNAKFAQDENAKAVSEHSEWDNREDENCPRPIRTEKQMASDEAGDEEDETGVNTAALGRHLHVESG